MLSKIAEMDKKTQQAETAARQAAQRQAAKIAAKRAYDLAMQQKIVIDQTTADAAILQSTIGQVMFIYLVIGGSNTTGDDMSTACNFVDLADAQTYAATLSYDYIKIYLNKTDGTFMLLTL
jgi:hypothetical protein